MEYPLPKLDLMYEARKGMAMENWGLVLFTPRTNLAYRCQHLAQ